MNLLRVALLGVMLGIALPSKADETWAMVSCCSKHWRVGENQYNEDNRGVSLEHVMPSRDYLIVGGYRNSFYRQSMYAGYGFQLWRIQQDGIQVESSVIVGGVTGYGGTEGEQNRHRPFLMPALTIRGERFGVMVTGAPGVMVGLGLEMRMP